MSISKIIRIFFLLLVTIVMVRCIEPYEPEVVEYESSLVVDGFYNNSDSPSNVILSQSFGYQEDVPEYIDNAQVTIEDDQGRMMTLLHMGNGLYQTDPISQKGEVGRSYRLLIDIPERGNYISGWEAMLASTLIGEIDIEYQEKERNDPDAKNQVGAQVFLSTEDTEKEVSFYKWELEETYLYNLIFDPQIKAVFGSNPGRGQDSIIVIPFSLRQGNICYKTELSKSILISSTEGLTENKVNKFPLIFVTNETARFYIRYSLLTKQFSISKEYHENLRKVAEVNQTTGSLFDPIPNEIFGNIKNVNDDTEPILGYFGVGGVSEKRIFIERGDLPMRFPVPFGPFCLSDTLDLDFEDLYSKTSTGSLVLSRYHTNLFGTPIGYIITQPDCVYCTSNDATNQAPDFW